MRQMIKLFTDKNNIILDPFCGSGSTCIACKQLNRTYIGFEINEKYVNITNERLKTTTTKNENGWGLRKTNYLG